MLQPTAHWVPDRKTKAAKEAGENINDDKSLPVHALILPKKQGIGIEG
jgi:hypothetical protein